MTKSSLDRPTAQKGEEYDANRQTMLKGRKKGRKEIKREMNVYVQFYATPFFSSLASYMCLFLLLLFFAAFSEDGDDVILQCPGTKDSIDVEEIKVEEGQVNKLLSLSILECLGRTR